MHFIANYWYKQATTWGFLCVDVLGIDNYLAPWRGAKHCDAYDYLSVCLSVSRTRKPDNRTSPFLMYVACDHDPVLLWWRCGTLCTSNELRHVFISWGQWARIKHDVMCRRWSPGDGTSCMSDNYRVFGRVHKNPATGEAKSAMYDWLVEECTGVLITTSALCEHGSNFQSRSLS